VDIEEGQRVEKDQIIARLDDSNTKASLDAARAQVGLAEARLQAARTSVSDNLPIFQRSEKLREKGWVSDTEFDATRTTYDKSKSDGVVAERNLDVARNDVEVALRNEDDTIIRAPFSGVVTVKDAQPGEVISPLSTGGFTRTGICTIVDMDSLEIEVDVSENFINRVHSRQNAVLQLNAYPDWRIPARVVATIPSADRAKATVKVRLEIEAKDPRILPDMGARVSFLDDTPPPVTHESGARLMVPVAAVSRQDDKTFVFVLRGNTIERRAISVGRESGGELEVLSGLQADTQLAIGDFSKLQDGAQVDVRNN
jgi:RND family efflux transporter MFP subunit